MASLMDRFYRRIRHRSARSVAEGRSTVKGFDHLRGRKYCLLVTYRRDGQAVPTPVWFGLGDDGKVYVRTEAGAAKVRRVANDPHVRVAPCRARGQPLGPPAEGRGRLLVEAADEERAEAALAANYGLGRRLYERAVGAGGVYLEITPA